MPYHHEDVPEYLEENPDRTGIAPGPDPHTWPAEHEAALRRMLAEKRATDLGGDAA